MNILRQISADERSVSRNRVRDTMRKYWHEDIISFEGIGMTRADARQIMIDDGATMREVEMWFIGYERTHQPITEGIQ